MVLDVHTFERLVDVAGLELRILAPALNDPLVRECQAVLAACRDVGEFDRLELHVAVVGVGRDVLHPVLKHFNFHGVHCLLYYEPLVVAISDT